MALVFRVAWKRTKGALLRGTGRWSVGRYRALYAKIDDLSGRGGSVDRPSNRFHVVALALAPSLGVGAALGQGRSEHC